MKDRYPNFIHNKKSRFFSSAREIVFGVEDGIISTLGVITGIAIATNDLFLVIVAGLVVISVESVSMGIGAYLSSQSVNELDDKIISEEKIEVHESMDTEKEELRNLYYQDGWPRDLADQMTEAASRDENLMLREMEYRELGILPERDGNSFTKGLVMFLSYIFGGFIPLLAYLIFPISAGVIFSIIFAGIGLFSLGGVIARYSNVAWWKVGTRILVLGGVSTCIGFAVGALAEMMR
ncbi:VIT1/CCC1 transporter family protein [Patescibacteria group bacterium]